MDDETTLRDKVATLTRMLNKQGSIGMFGHISARVPDTTRMIISPGGGTDKSTVRPQDCLIFDLDGTLIENPGKLIPIEWRIHTRVHRDRPDAGCVCHLHAEHAVAMGIAGRKIEPVFLHGSFLCTGVPTWDNPRLVMNDEEAGSLSAALGDKIVVQMRGHGSVVVGETCEAAFFACTFLEENARKQFEAAVLGNMIPLSAAEAKDCMVQTYNPRLFNLLWSYHAPQVAL